MPEYTFTNRKCTDDGLIIECKIDGVDAVYLPPDLLGRNLLPWLTSTGMLSSLSFFFGPGAAIPTVLMFGTFNYFNYRGGGYYKRDSNERTFDKRIYEGKVYEHQLTNDTIYRAESY